MKTALYLHRLILDPRSRKVRRDLADCYEMHRTVNGMFEGQAVHQAGPDRVLYRVEATGELARWPRLIIQAATPADFGCLPEGYLAGVSEPNPASKRIDGMLDTIVGGMQLRFRLRANPTRKTRLEGADGEPRSARVEVRSEDALVAWLRRKGEHGGFRVVEVLSGVDATFPPVADVSISPAKLTGHRRRESDSKRLTFGSVLFEGHLCVTGAERLKAVVREGIGSGKAFGFGLLSLGPAA